jgi:hypothetical protein
MRISKFFAAAAAVSLVASPLMAQGSASKLSVARAGAAMQDASNQDESAGGGGVILGVAAAIAVGLGIYVAVDNGGDDEDDLPTSP